MSTEIIDRVQRTGAVKGLRFEVTSPAPRAAWQEASSGDPAAFVYQTPRGIDAICAGLGCEDVSRMYEFSNGRRLIVPLYRSTKVPRLVAVRRSPLIGSIVGSGGPQLDELRAIFADLQADAGWRTIVNPAAMQGELWAAAAPQAARRIRRIAHVLDLAGGFDVVWKSSFNSQARRAVRKAEKAPLQIDHDSTGRLVPVFYELLKLSIDRWAEQSHEPRVLAQWRAARSESLEQARRKAGVLGENCKIWVANIEGRPAAAIIVLQGSNAHYTRGAMDIDLAGPVRANFLLQKLAIEEACRAGCRYYNMGETGGSESLARFKSHFGAREYAYAGLCFERFPVTAVEASLRKLSKRLLRAGSTSSA